jgi:Regulator of chromosome condensation (RCC1) repeat/IPT/TIG domain
MRVGLLDGPCTTRSRRLALALILGFIATYALAIASPARAHEPYGAKAWGENHEGQLGDGTFEGPEKCGPTKNTPCSATPVAVSNLSGVVAVAGGEGHSLALLEDGTVWAWGADEKGQLGDGRTGERSDVPVKVTGLSERVTAIAAGNQFSLALLESGKVVSWGANEAGELGDASTTSSDVPVEVTGLGERVKAIAANSTGQFALALLESGKVVAWGTNGSGQLGNGTTKGSEIPREVGGLSEKVTAIAAGRLVSLALLEGGTVVAWGNNTFGELGNGTETNSSVPVPVKGLSAVAALAASDFSSFALLNGTGKVMSWGRNEVGELGDGTSTGPEMCGITAACAKVPAEVSGPSGVTAIAAGAQNGIALYHGAALDWGLNEYGGVGDGSTLGPEPCGTSGTCATKPVQVSALASVRGIGYGGGEPSHGFGLAFGPTAPTVTGVSPNEPRKKGTTRVTITGTELEEATSVKFGNAAASGVKVSANGTIIEAEAPAGKGSVDVTVTTPVGTSATSEDDRFYYSRPTLKRVSPKRGPETGGTSVTIKGTRFAGVTAVRFGSTEATSFKVKSETEITAVSPGHALGFVDVIVSASGGTTAITHKDRFKYT